ncbi:hypothetical protein Vretifemale_3752 [Volvox reticuliferus]|nr:hypothetical protein Vretifemale_3752 [Volvox reticuliferus]
MKNVGSTTSTYYGASTSIHPHLRNIMSGNNARLPPAAAIAAILVDRSGSLQVTVTRTHLVTNATLLLLAFYIGTCTLLLLLPASLAADFIQSVQRTLHNNVRAMFTICD